MDGEIETAAEAAGEFKNTVIYLVKLFEQVVVRHERGRKTPAPAFNLMDTLQDVASSGGDITKLFTASLSPLQKIAFAKKWAEKMDAETVVRDFVNETRSHWDALENGTMAEREAKIPMIIRGMSIPSAGAEFLDGLYEKKSMLTSEEKAAIDESIQTFVWYARMYHEISTEKNGRR